MSLESISSATGITSARQLTASGFAVMADDTDQTLRAIKTLAFGGIQSQQRLASNVLERLDRLEEAS